MRYVPSKRGSEGSGHRSGGGLVPRRLIPNAVGNLLSFQRQTPGTVSIITFTPTSGPSRASVTIAGTGFSANAESEHSDVQWCSGPHLKRHPDSAHRDSLIVLRISTVGWFSQPVGMFYDDSSPAAVVRFGFARLVLAARGADRRCRSISLRGRQAGWNSVDVRVKQLRPVGGRDHHAANNACSRFHTCEHRRCCRGRRAHSGARERRHSVGVGAKQQRSSGGRHNDGRTAPVIVEWSPTRHCHQRGYLAFCCPRR